MRVRVVRICKTTYAMPYASTMRYRKIANVSGSSLISFSSFRNSINFNEIRILYAILDQLIDFHRYLLLVTCYVPYTMYLLVRKRSANLLQIKTRTFHLLRSLLCYIYFICTLFNAASASASSNRHYRIHLTRKILCNFTTSLLRVHTAPLQRNCIGNFFFALDSASVLFHSFVWSFPENLLLEV